MQKVNMLEYALKYREMGFSVVPVKGKDGHVVKWSQFQTELPSESQIKEWWEDNPYYNIGIVTGKISGITVFDIDSYKLTDKEKSEIEKCFPSCATPIVHSASGGEHRYFAYDPDIQTKNDVMKGLDIKNDGGIIIAPPSQNNGKFYKWDERARISIVTPREIPPSYKDIIKEKALYNRGVTSNTISQEVTNVTQSHKYYLDGRRDEDLFHAGNCLLRGGADVDFARQTLELIANNLGDEFGPKVVNAKINSVLNRIERQNRNIAEEIRLWVESQEGHFKVTDMYQELTISHKSQKHASIMAIKRLCEGENPILEKYGSQRGVYRKIESACDDIEWWDTEKDNALQDVKWILGLDKLIYTMPKNVYVIAGDQDAGKSALCLNMAILNCRKYDVTYFSSEMAGQELGSRLQLHDGFDLELFRSKIKFKDRSKNFADVIQPNDINIIDYLEITENFYAIAKDLTDIRNKLKNGIAIVALQKKRGVDLGRGAEFSLEKPRLYLSVGSYFPKHSKIPDGNAVKIIKAKNWANPEVNPNGQFHRFKLYKGINLKPAGVWEHEIA